MPVQKSLLLLLMMAAGAAKVEAQTTITLPDSSLKTQVIFKLLDTAVVSVPAGVTFNVTNIAASTAASGTSVSVTSILIPLTSKVKISLQAGAAAFTPPVVGATTWSAGDVSWNAAPWTNGAGSAGTLSSSTFNQVATCTAGISACSTTGLVLTLGQKPTVRISGHHTLTITWKFEAI